MQIGILLALAQAITWALTSIILRSLSSLDPFLVNGLRAAFGLLVILPLIALSGGVADYQLITIQRLAFLAGSIAVGGALGDALFLSSLKLLGVGRAFPITNTYPLFTMLFSAMLLRERIAWAMAAGAILVVAGVYLVARPRGHVQSQSEPPLSPRQVLMGVLMALGTAMTWGFSSVVLALGLRGINSLVANSVRVPVLVSICLVAAVLRGQVSVLRQLSRRYLLLIALGGILGWGISGTLFVNAVQLAGPSKTAIVSAMAPLFAVPLGALFLHERPTRYTLAGTILSMTGIVLVVL